MVSRESGSRMRRRLANGSREPEAAVGAARKRGPWRCFSTGVFFLARQIPAPQHGLSYSASALCKELQRIGRVVDHDVQIVLWVCSERR